MWGGGGRVALSPTALFLPLAQAVIEATNKLFQTRVSVKGYECRLQQLQGLLEESKEENRRLTGELKGLQDMLQYRGGVSVCAEG